MIRVLRLIGLGLACLLVVALVTTTRTVGRTESARDAAESATNANARNVETFFTLSTDMLCVADWDGLLQRVNYAWEETLGWTVEACPEPVEGAVVLM